MHDIGLRVERVKGPSCMPEAHRHSEVEVNFIVHGTLSYWRGGGLASLEAGSISAFWAAYPHRVVADSDDLEFYWLTVPLSAFLSWEFPKSLVDDLMSGSVVRQSRVASAEAEKLLWDNWVETCGRRGAGGFELDVLRWEVKARLGRFFLQAETNQPAFSRRSSGMSRGVEKMVRYIGRNFREPVKVADIAAHAGLNSNYATEAFHQVFGLGIKDYLNRQRIAEAQRLLLTTEQTVLEICHGTGFGSPSRFYDWFQRLCGTSPEQYRRQGRGG